jgi:type IX secretion system PorP/SprF family membrane protein
MVSVISNKNHCFKNQNNIQMNITLSSNIRYLTIYFTPFISWLIMIVSVCFYIWPASEVAAQNDPMLNHSFLHQHVFNPAHAGNERNITAGLLARQQWIGFKEAPSTQLLNAYGYIPKIKGGAGLVVVNDMLGKERSLAIRLSYAYRQRLGNNAFISGGISVGILNRAVKGNELIYQQEGDQYMLNNMQSMLKPDIGFGLEFLMSGLTLGASVTHLHQSLKNATVFKVPRHYFGYARYDWNVSDKIMLTPALFVRSSQFITQADVNLNMTVNKRILTGVFYRTADDAGLMLGVYLGRFLVSYSYDFDFGELSTNQSGSHELTLIGRFGIIKPKSLFYKSPRYLN